MTRPRWTPFLGTTAFWVGVALLFAAETWFSMLGHGHSLGRLTLYQLVVWFGWALLTGPVLWLTRRFPLLPLRAPNLGVHLVAALLLAVVHGAFRGVAEVVIHPFHPVASSRLADVPGLMQARLVLGVLVYFGISAVVHTFDFYRRAGRLQESLAAARWHALELQIQPHFLFNTLNAVSALVRNGQRDEAVEMIAGLSDLLRYSLDHSGAQGVSLDQEVTILRRYLDIQQARFSDRLEVQLDVAEETRRACVPALILQPLAENAIRHGIATSARGGRIEVAATRRDGHLRLEVFNSGSLREGAVRGIGLSNTEERLRQLYGDRQSLELSAARGGVLAVITLPWSEVE